MWDLIVSVPDHCLSFYLPAIQIPWFPSHSLMYSEQSETNGGEMS